MNGDVITWDDDTLEVNINGQDYLGSSIVDILSYLTDKNSNDLFYMTGDYDTTDRLMLGMPQNTIEVVKALNYLILSCSEEFQGISFFFIIMKYRNYQRGSHDQSRLMLHLMFH